MAGAEVVVVLHLSEHDADGRRLVAQRARDFGNLEALCAELDDHFAVHPLRFHTALVAVRTQEGRRDHRGALSHAHLSHVVAEQDDNFFDVLSRQHFSDLVVVQREECVLTSVILLARTWLLCPCLVEMC